LEYPRSLPQSKANLPTYSYEPVRDAHPGIKEFMLKEGTNIWHYNASGI
jgi:hypothetical protein